MPRKMTAYENAMQAERILADVAQKRRVHDISIEEAQLEVAIAAVHATLAAAGELRG